jgi:hypothetical protein
MMSLPLPRARLANCVWLPRLVAKVRGIARNTLPTEYVARLCDHDSVDEHFLRFFEISKDDLMAAVHRFESDDAIAHWFRALPAMDEARVARWNDFAENLGRPGFPMASRFAEVLPKMYRHLDPTSVHSIFDLLEADEKSAARQPLKEVPTP